MRAGLAARGESCRNHEAGYICQKVSFLSILRVHSYDSFLSIQQFATKIGTNALIVELSRTYEQTFNLFS